MCHRHLILTIGLGLCLMLCGLASDSHVSAADTEITFDPPPTVVVRKTDGRSARGRLLSITADQVRLRLVRGDEIELELDEVRRIGGSTSSRLGRRTTGQFEYIPSLESFDELVNRVSRIPNSLVVGGRPTVRRSQSQPPSSPNTDSDDDGKRSPFARGQNARPAPVEPRRYQVETPPNTGSPLGNSGTNAKETDVDEEAPPVTNGVSEIYVCSHCEHDLPAGFQSGGKCPHCGWVALFEEESAELAANDPIAKPTTNPFAPQAGGGREVRQQPAADRGGRLNVAAAAQNPAPAAKAPPFSFANMPTIAKVGIFLGFIVVGWFILQRR